MKKTDFLQRAVLDLNVLYEDNHLLVVCKTPGILSQKDHSDQDSMVEVIKEYIRNKYQKPGNIYVGLIHRLDRNVGGVMVFAKTSKAAARLSDQIRNNLFIKEYIACVEGMVELTKQRLTHYLRKDEKYLIAITQEFMDENAKEAILEYEILRYGSYQKETVTYLKVNLITGRFHQIRAQLAAIGHPIVGDSKYQSSISSKDFGLWCSQITLLHPIKQEKMTFTKIPNSKIWNENK